VFVIFLGEFVAGRRQSQLRDFVAAINDGTIQFENGSIIDSSGASRV
jgi:hypothetical protein